MSSYWLFDTRYRSEFGPSVLNRQTDPLRTGFAERTIWPPAVSAPAYGVAVTGIFVVSQSWLNDASDNQWCGKVIAAFYLTYVISIGFGAFLLRFVSPDGEQAA